MAIAYVMSCAPKRDVLQHPSPNPWQQIMYVWLKLSRAVNTSVPEEIEKMSLNEQAVMGGMVTG